MALPTLTLDSRGFEHHFAINHLGHFQLTERLLPALRAAQGARVVAVSARAHQVSEVVFSDLFFQHPSTRRCGDTGSRRPPTYAVDLTNAVRLWELSERPLGLS